MDIAEIRRKAKELKDREDALIADKGVALETDGVKDSAEVSSNVEEPIIAADDDFIIDDDAALPSEEILSEESEEVSNSHGDNDGVSVGDTDNDEEVFELTHKEDFVIDPVADGGEVADVFIDDIGGTEAEDSVDAIMLSDVPSADELLKEEETDVISVVEADEVGIDATTDTELVVEEDGEEKICLEAITFMLDDEEYGIDIDGITEVIKPRELTGIPRAPENIMGVFSLRGVMIPVMDLRKRLAMAHDKEGERVIIVKDGEEQLGLVVDNIVGAVSLTRKAIEPPPSFSSIDGELISAICRCENGESFILLNVGRVVEKS